jgi:NAD+ kinase
VATNPQMPEAGALAPAIAERINSDGGAAACGSIHDAGLRQGVQRNEFDVLIALGGDGTMLRAGHLCAPCGVPILGINVGRLGFLTEVDRDAWLPAVRRLMEGQYWIEKRMMLKATHYRNGHGIGQWEALNECVVGRGGVVRAVRLVTEIDGRYITTYIADALIAATPTGSTAYALAAGGPILPPELRNILIMPVAPHMSFDRAIVLHEASTVRITVRTDHTAALSVDGQQPVPMYDDDQLEARAGEHSVQFVRLQDPGYFYRALASRTHPKP